MKTTTVNKVNKVKLPPKPKSVISEDEWEISIDGIYEGKSTRFTLETFKDKFNQLVVAFEEEHCFKDNILNSSDDEETLKITIRTLGKSKILTSKFSCAIAELPFTCGLLEIGSIKFDNVKNFPMSILQDCFEILLRETKYTYICNTVQVGCSFELAKYFTKSPLFAMVKSYKNPNSGNTITTWMTTN